MWTDDFPELVFGDFGLFLRDRIMSNGSSDELVRKAFKFLDTTFEGSTDIDLQNLLQVGVFEPLCDRQETVSTALSSLTGEARASFLATLSWMSPDVHPR
jgi:hypothetical protein